MSFIFPIGASVLQASSFTLDKVILNIKRVTHKTYMGVSFPLIAIFTLIIFLIFRPPLSLDLFAGKYIWLIIVSIILTAVTNIIYYRALKSDSLAELQTISLLREIPLIIFAAIVFTDERNILIIILAIIAVSSVAWSHWEKGHFKIAKKTIPFLIFSMLVVPFRAIIIKTILDLWNPISFQLVNNVVSGIIFGFIFRQSIRDAPKKSIPWLLLTNILTTIAWILYFFSFQKSGIIYTTLIFASAPILVYFASLIFLKEKFHWKKAVALMIILGAIITAQILG